MCRNYNSMNTYNIKTILEFFDDRNNYHKGDVNAVVAVLGEDLNVAVYKHFRKNRVDVLEESVTQGFQGGKYLDRWIVDKKDNTLQQCEIKNWSATAIGGRELKIDANTDLTREVVQYYWDREIGDKGNLSRNPRDSHPNGVSKVLLKMRKPNGYEQSKVDPLIIYWMPISLDKERLNPLSILPVKYLHSLINSEFSKLYIFSVSLYLRQLYKNGKGKQFINLDMPAFDRRLEVLLELSKK